MPTSASFQTLSQKSTEQINITYLQHFLDDVVENEYDKETFTGEHEVVHRCDVTQ